ncbi:MAG TPA: ATP-binding protein [Streptosporangiaceae bacterium]|nr:ATP-binding protein [Streptosporangiaceae bacterium]
MASSPLSGRAVTVHGAAGTPGPAVPEEPGSGAGPAFQSQEGLPSSTFTRWPLRDYLELGALPGAVPCARLHARLLIREWGLAALADDVEILVSELVTNAVQATRALGQAVPVRLWLLADAARILIIVWDASPQLPVRAGASTEAESGRGLLLVEALSHQWGTSAAPAGGKTVWALTAMP